MNINNKIKITSILEKSIRNFSLIYFFMVLITVHTFKKKKQFKIKKLLNEQIPF